MAKDVSKAKSYRRTRAFIDFVLSVALIAACTYIVKGAVDRSEIVDSSAYFDNTDLEKAKLEADKADPSKTVFENISVKTSDVYRGDLILVNEDYEYHSGGEDLVGINEMNERTNRDFFSAVDYDYTIIRQAYEPMAKMIEDFYKKYDNTSLIIYGSYRTTEFQKQLYEDDLANSGDDASTRVALPGHSEHETGYAFDFSETETNDYQGTGDYAWINENSYKYGFVERYKEDKTDITKIQIEPWHFRYVGIPHAYYMVKNNLCLEEYVESVRQYTYGGNTLQFTAEDGVTYEIYYVPVDMNAESAEIPVPAGKKYDISGNNYDGFIVTLYKNGDGYISADSKPDTEKTSENTEETSESTDENAEDTEKTTVAPTL